LTAVEILHRAHYAGLHLRVDRGRILARPARALTPGLADAIRANRPAVIDALVGGKVLLFPTRPTGTSYRLWLAPNYQTDAVKNGEPCPTCQGTDWRLVSAGLWLCDQGHYWSPRRLAEKSDALEIMPPRPEAERKDAL
jgi:hypothetical protein